MFVRGYVEMRLLGSYVMCGNVHAQLEGTGLRNVRRDAQTGWRKKDGREGNEALGKGGRKDVLGEALHGADVKEGV